MWVWVRARVRAGVSVRVRVRVKARVRGDGLGLPKLAELMKQQCEVVEGLESVCVMLAEGLGAGFDLRAASTLKVVSPYGFVCGLTLQARAHSRPQARAPLLP